MLARVCRAGISPQVGHFLKSPVIPKNPKVQVVRLLASDGRSTFTRTARRRTGVVEEAMAPAGETGKKKMQKSQYRKSQKIQKKKTAIHRTSMRLIKMLCKFERKMLKKS